jgi:formyltetrahydrofolate synthetase
MFTQSFPPADAFLEQVSQIEYKKHLQQFVMFIATVVAVVVAVSQFIYTKAAQWYQSGGKELMQSYAHRAVLFINNKTQVFDKLYSATVSINNRIELFAHKISDVTDVEVAQ